MIKELVFAADNYYIRAIWHINRKDKAMKILRLISAMVIIFILFQAKAETIGPGSQCIELAAQKALTVDVHKKNNVPYRTWVQVGISNHWNTAAGTLIQVSKSDSSRKYDFYPGDGNNFRLASSQSIVITNRNDKNTAQVCLDPGNYQVDVK